MKDFDMKINEYLPLRDVVFNTLRTAILKGELKPGERLMEIALANRLGVSRTPIREAIRKLELEGLVVMIPRKGAEVARITEKDLRDVLEVRCSLEQLAVRLACLRITPEGIHALEKACMNFEEAAKSDDVSLNDLAEKDIAFHDVIYNATGNTRLISILSNMWEQMYRYRLEYLKSGAQHAKLIEEHRKILETVSAGNADMAEKVITEHVTEQERCVMEKIRSESGEENGK